MFCGLFGQELMNIGGSPLLMKIKSEAQAENIITFAEMFNRFSNLAITRIIWDGLPSSVDERFLNTALYIYGQAAFFEDPNMGFMALPCTVAGEYNAYYNPTSVEAYSFNYRRRLTQDEFVFIRNNPTRTPTAWPVFEYTKRMADLLRSMDVLNKKLKQPYLITCDEKQRLTYENILKKVSDNEWFILGAKDFGLDKNNLQVVDLKVNPYFEDIWYSYHSIEQILYTALGIESRGEDKKERVLVDEVNANNMVTDMSVFVTLKELEAACEKINEKYGLNVSVKMKTVTDYRKEDGRNGSVYDGAPQSD